MSTPLRSFIGGVGLALPVHFFLKLNGAVFGISGFLHNAFRGDKEALAAAFGLVLGGLFPVDHTGPEITVGIPKIIFSGLLVGIGTRLSQGCTSGSIVATATFFFVGVGTTQLLYGSDLPPAGPPNYTLEPNGRALLALQVLPLTISCLLYNLAPASQPSLNGRKLSAPNGFSSKITSDDINPFPQSTLRLLAALVNSFNFSLALRVSNLTDPSRVISFLLLPLHHAFDPSLLYLAAGALPLSIGLYHFARGEEKSRLGGQWSVPQGGTIDVKFLAGAALFGIGWALGGICPGPGLVNLGRAISSGVNVVPSFLWVASVAFGGLLV